MTHRHEAVSILILSALLGMALLSAGYTRIPLGSETSVTVPADNLSEQAAASSMNMNNNPDIPKNPDGSESGASTPPNGNVCDSSDNNSGTCLLPTTPETRNPATEPQISDPAAAYCTDMNNRLEIRKNADGSESGVCILSDGTECNTLEYYQGVCPPSPIPELEAQNPDAGPPGSDPAADYCTNMNNRLEIRQNPDGSESGVCILSDGTECDTLEYYQGVCPPSPTPEPEAQNPDAGTPGSDPAADYCTNMNNRFEIRQNPDGSDYGVCILADGTECDAIAYYEGTCPNAPALEDIPVDETIVNQYEALCRAKNFMYEIRMNPDGSEHGVCIFPNGRACDSWDYYFGDCSEETALEEP